MRTTKVMAFSVPPELEEEIVEHAKAEHRTISEYLREAIRQYMTITQFKVAQKRISTKIKKKKITQKDLELALNDVRKKK